jgi:hypothetical protein
MNDHGFVSFVVVMFYHTEYLVQLTTTSEIYPWSFITTQNTWFNLDYDKRNIYMIIHYHTEYLIQPWLPQRKQIHDHSLPHKISCLNQAFCVVMNDHGYVSFVVVMFEPSILCGNEWSWMCFVCRRLPHRILDSTITTTNETYPWSFITTQNTWFNYDYDKRNISMIIHYHTEYLVQLWLRQTKHIHDHSFLFVVVMFEPSIMWGNEWSWICFVCRSYGWIKYFVW